MLKFFGLQMVCYKFSEFLAQPANAEKDFFGSFPFRESLNLNFTPFDDKFVLQSAKMLQKYEQHNKWVKSENSTHDNLRIRLMQ